MLIDDDIGGYIVEVLAVVHDLDGSAIFQCDSHARISGNRSLDDLLGAVWVLLGHVTAAAVATIGAAGTIGLGVRIGAGGGGIDLPLFLDGLKEELEKIKEIQVEKTRRQKAMAFCVGKLSNTIFLDPARGSGNFLTETYISLRRLENEALRLVTDQIVLGEFSNPVQGSIDQFYGIETNNFAVTVAKTALWIAESQMLKETEDIVAHQIDFLPLKTNAHIVEGNALRMDWESVVPKEKLNYISINESPLSSSLFWELPGPRNEQYSLESEIKQKNVLAFHLDCYYNILIELHRDSDSIT